MINLLPPQHKKELKAEESYKIALILGFIFLFLLISLSLILFSIKIYIESQTSSLEVLAKLERQKLETPAILNFRQEIISAGQSLEKLAAFYEGHKSTTDMFQELARTFPAGLHLNSFAWNRGSSQVTLTGHSPTREILFEFRENLEENEKITRINFPPAVWATRTDIGFSVTFNMEI